MIQKTVGVKFLRGEWGIITVQMECDKKGEPAIPLTLDHLWPAVTTSIRFKGFSKSGRILYHEVSNADS